VGCQHVGVGDFVSGAFESFDFDDPLVGQFCEDVVGFAQTDAHPAGHVSLGEAGVVGQDFKDFVAYFLFVVTVHAANIRLVGVGCQGDFIGGERSKVKGERVMGSGFPYWRCLQKVTDGRGRRTDGRGLMTDL